jgi:hypothetical protein
MDEISSPALPQNTFIGNRNRHRSVSYTNIPLNHEYTGDDMIDILPESKNTATKTTTPTPTTTTTTSSILNPNINNSKLDNNVTSSSSLDWLLEQQQPQQTPNHDQDPISIALTVTLPLLLLMAYIFFVRSSVPGPEYWRGAQIRENARRIREARLRRRARQELLPDQRREQILANMRIMTIVGKDRKTGIFTLGQGSEDDEVSVPPTLKEEKQQQSMIVRTHEEQHHHHQDATNKTSCTKDTEENLLDDDSDNDDCTTKASNIFRESSSDQVVVSTNEDHEIGENDNSIDVDVDFHKQPVMLIRSKGSQDTADTQRLDAANGFLETDEEDDVCYICLDNFDVGDVVMWSPQRRCCYSSSIDEHNQNSNNSNNISNTTTLLGCQHVFHHECLMPWLMEKRENECPSCRALFILDDKSVSNEEEEVDRRGNSTTNVMDHAQEHVEVDQELAFIQLPLGDGSGTTNMEPSTDDVEADTEKEYSNDDDVHHDITEDIQDGYSYVIVKGLVQVVPNHHH